MGSRSGTERPEDADAGRARTEVRPTDERADELLAALWERDASGPDAEAIAAGDPDLAEVLRERLAALDVLDRAFAGASGAPVAAGDDVGPYRLVRELGRGGMGVVYEAAGADGARVAVKILRDDLSRLPRARERFLREAEIGRRVRHANVVSFLDFGEAGPDGRRAQYLVLEYVEGRTLLELVEQMGSLPEALVRHVGREVARGLAAIHAAGAVHRDVKPENVLITTDHVVKLTDLGVARLRIDGERLSLTGGFVGSLPFCAPEQVRRTVGAIDARTDLHGLGVTLYELATGRSPFRDDDAHVVIDRVLHEIPRRLGELNPQVSPFLEDLIARLLEKDPAKRLESADLVARILDEGEASSWWKTRAAEIEAATKRPLRRMKVPRETALHGRDAEMAKLRAAWDEAKAGRGAIVLVEGEAGIGKTRLVDEFVAALEREGEDLNFLFGSYPPGGAATASGAFTTAYREHFGAAGSRALIPDSPILVPAFDALLRGELPPEGAQPLTKDSIQTCFVRSTQNLAKERPTVVLIDDLHFAPEEGRALFASLALGTTGHRVLLVGTARPDLDPKWAQGIVRIGILRLSLARLSLKDLVELLADALRSRHLAEELGAKIALGSDGIPYFAFEILRALREGLFVTRRDDGTWIRTKEIRELQIPPSITELVQARVTALGREDRNLLEPASCIGFQFDPGLLADVLRRDPVAVLQDLGQIEKEHRLVRAVGPRFEFDHHQVAEVLYTGLSDPLRTAYHAAIGTAIESRHAPADAAPASIDGALYVGLAEHFLKGARGAQAVRYLDAALSHLERGYLNEPAIAVADRALAAPGLLAGKERVEILLRKAARLDLLGRREVQSAALDEACDVADAVGDQGLRAKARISRGHFLRGVSRLAEAEAEARIALDLACTAEDRRSVASATGVMGNVFRDLGRFAEAQAQLERHLALAREIGDRQGEAHATGNLGIVLWSLGRFAEAQAQFERCLALAREIGDRQGEAFATGNLGNVLYSLGRFAEAQVQFERCLALARAIGDRQAAGTVTGSLGNVFQALGRFALAQAQHERHLALAREVGHRRGEALATGNLGCVLHALGRFAEARAQHEWRLALAREIGDGSGEGRALAELGSVADEEGDAERAVRKAEASLALLREIGDWNSILNSMILFGDLMRRSGAVDEARAALEEAVTRSREQGQKDVVALALALLANLPGGDAKAAEAALAEAGESRAVPQVRFLLWTATHDRVHLVEAKRHLDFMVEHAPPEDRESMLANVRLHREIVAACKAEGID